MKSIVDKFRSLFERMTDWVAMPSEIRRSGTAKEGWRKKRRLERIARRAVADVLLHYRDSRPRIREGFVFPIARVFDAAPLCICFFVRTDVELADAASNGLVESVSETMRQRLPISHLQGVTSGVTVDFVSDEAVERGGGHRIYFQ